MKGLRRKLAWILATASTWGVAWAGLSSLVVVGYYAWAGAWTFFWMTLFPVAALGAAAGFMAGGLFMLVVELVQRRVAPAGLTPLRVAVWAGAVGALLPSLLFAGGVALRLSFDVLAALGVIACFGTFCALSGAATAMLARRFATSPSAFRRTAVS